MLWVCGESRKSDFGVFQKNKVCAGKWRWLDSNGTGKSVFDWAGSQHKTTRPGMGRYVDESMKISNACTKQQITREREQWGYRCDNGTTEKKMAKKIGIRCQRAILHMTCVYMWWGLRTSIGHLGMRRGEKGW